jgi:hypothetical protein
MQSEIIKFLEHQLVMIGYMQMIGEKQQSSMKAHGGLHGVRGYKSKVVRKYQRVGLM